MHQCGGGGHSGGDVGDADKETDAITLSAVAIRTCSCGASKESTADKNVAAVDEMDAFPTNHRSNTELRWEIRSVLNMDNINSYCISCIITAQ